jgi:hypothetical protein
MGLFMAIPWSGLGDRNKKERIKSKHNWQNYKDGRRYMVIYVKYMACKFHGLSKYYIYIYACHFYLRVTSGFEPTTLVVGVTYLVELWTPAIAIPSLLYYKGILS